MNTCESPLPPGTFLIGDFLGPVELRRLFDRLSAVEEWSAVRFRGQLARRSILPFGVCYDVGQRRVAPAPPMPGWLCSIRDRAVEAARAAAGDALVLAGGSAGDFTTSTVIRYPTGGGIGWHTDAPVHGPTVLDVSVGAPAWFELRPRPPHAPPDPMAVRLRLEPGSLLVLAGEARQAWAHRVPPVRAPRFSLTFRSRARAA